MKILYLDCSMGASGSMIMSALLKLCERPDKMRETIESLDSIKNSDVSDSVKKNAYIICDSLEKAEVHDLSLNDISEILGCCLLIETLKADLIIVSPINIGSGFVQTANGALPIPKPTTIKLLLGVPVYANSLNGELCTNVGAALLVHFADKFDSLPLMKISASGCGINSYDSTCVRAYIGDTDNNSNNKIAEISCNLDDMTGEAIGYACEILLENGALDVFSTPIQMKKGRPAVMLTCLCKVCDSDKFALLMLRHTTTIGVRKTICQRYILESTYKTVDNVNIKTSSGYGITKSKPEYSNIAHIAHDNDWSYNETLRNLKLY